MRHWAISVGINQYQFFQPLSYAQQDAQAMHRFLVADVGIPAAQCVLLTETSPPQWGKSTYPDRATIQSWLDLLVQRYVQPGDVLWCFFSGYGVCQQGQDYLVPIEGDPTAIPATAIPLEAIFRRLRQVTNATVLVLLDINRNESSSHELVGTHTVHLASITGIPTILSCQPGQFSRETSALGHGFFTAALLESLRDRHCTTLTAVERYLSDRLPELSDHYWRPIQLAVTICPDEKLQQPLLPLAMNAADTNGDRAFTAPTAQRNGFATANGAATATAIKPPSESNSYQPYGSAATGNGLWQPAVTKGQTVADQAIATLGTHADSGSPSSVSAQRSTHGSTPSNGAMPDQPQANGIRVDRPLDSATQNHENRGAPSVSVPTVPQSPFDPSDDANEIPDALFWRPILLWGGFAVVALTLGVLLRNCASFTPTPATAPKTGVAAPRPSSSVNGQGAIAASPSSALPPSVAVPAASPPAAIPPASPSPVSPAVKPDLSTGASSSATAKPIPPQTIAAGSGFGASGASRLAPATGQAAPTAQATQTKGATSIAPATSPLTKAKALVSANSNQASPYWYAIQEAAKLKPGQPDYAEARQSIALWSRQILSIARQRGRQGSYDAAIVAARLIPQDQPVYVEAKTALSRWCPALKRQQSANPVQWQQATAVCKMITKT